jgi:3-phosphoshikimate 1-carboxyvinyltransferase
VPPITSAAAGPLKGSVRVPGDKSISHRALMLGALAVGETVIHGLLEGEDVHQTATAMRAMGANVERGEDGVWRVRGRGVGGLREPDDVLDMGNAGTGARLLMGVVGSHPFTTFMTGDASLRSRPMERIAAPLRQIGAQVVSRDGGRLPLAVIGTDNPMPIAYTLPMPSAQVKSAVLLAGLNAPGVTTVIEPERTRDHTELMLRHFGAEVKITPDGAGGARIELTGQPELTGSTVIVPGDPSSAAFPIVAALICPGSEVELPNVGLNPLRTGLLTTLLEMGADISRKDERTEAGETVADLVVKASALKGVEVPPERAPTMIDEYPVLAMAAARAQGATIMHGVRELRVKESDRLDAVAQGLRACGVVVEETEDTLTVHGADGVIPGGGTVATRLDHRIAMSFLMLGLTAKAPITIDDAGPIDTSFPGFIDLMNSLGAKLSQQS